MRYAVYLIFCGLAGWAVGELIYLSITTRDYRRRLVEMEIKEADKANRLWTHEQCIKFLAAELREQRQHKTVDRNPARETIPALDLPTTPKDD